MLKRSLLAGIGIPLVVRNHALACPYCDSEIGREVKAGIFNGDFALNVALTLLPIPILLIVVGVIHFGMPRPRVGLTKLRSVGSRLSRKEG